MELNANQSDVKLQRPETETNTITPVVEQNQITTNNKTNTMINNSTATNDETTPPCSSNP